MLFMSYHFMPNFSLFAKLSMWYLFSRFDNGISFSPSQICYLSATLSLKIKTFKYEQFVLYSRYDRIQIHLIIVFKLNSLSNTDIIEYIY